MKRIFILWIIIFFSCNSKTKKENTEPRIADSVSITFNKYFNYDKIEYYKCEIEEDEIEELYDNQKKSLKDSLKMGIILGAIPKSVSDSLFINHLKYFGYTKSEIDSKKFPKIDEIFAEKKHQEFYETACIYVYRDILIFKKNEEIIGIAKICFDCDANIIVGTDSNTEGFGMSGDYEKLRKILQGK